VTTGQGDFCFTIDRHWAKLPANKRFGTTHAIAEDSAGRIFVFHTAPECVFLFSPSGDFLGSWGADYFAGAHGMDIRQEAEGEFLYLTSSSAGVVVKTTLAGEEVMRLGKPPRPDIYDGNRSYQPTETAVAKNGDIFVADGYGQYWVHHFSPRGEYIASFNGAPNTLDNPHGIGIDTRSGDERLLVADRGHHVLRTFDLNGRPLAIIDAGLRFPCSAVQSGDFLYVPDLHSRVTVLDRANRPVAQIGDWPGRWEAPGWPNLANDDGGERVSSPHDLAIDAAGNIYLAEWHSDGTGDVAKLTRLAR
jgi:hypothetical protein